MALAPELKNGKTPAILIPNPFYQVYAVAAATAGADPVFDDPRAEDIFRATHATLIVQDMFLTQTADLADVVLPTQSIAEHDGTYTSGERRIQRFYQAIEPAGESWTGWQIAHVIGERLGHPPGKPVATLIFNEIALSAPPYEGIAGSALTSLITLVLVLMAENGRLFSNPGAD